MLVLLFSLVKIYAQMHLEKKKNLDFLQPLRTVTFEKSLQMKIQESLQKKESKIKN